MEWIIRVILLITLAFSAVMLFLCRSGRITAEEDQRKDLRLIAVTSLCLLILEAAYPFLADFGSRLPFPSGDRLLLLVCYLIPWAIIGREILSEAFTEIRRGGFTGENFLMAVASVGALILAVLDNGEFREAVAVLLFYRIGEWLEDYASEKSRSHIRGLMELRPDRASVLRGGIWSECDPAEVAVGETVRVLPGERIPMDGIVTSGASALNTSALTGESIPREVAPGDEVLSGCLCLTGVLEIRTRCSFGESTASRILALMENADASGSRSVSFMTRFSSVYTPVVCAAAAVLGLLVPLFRILFLSADPAWTVWIRRALVFLVTSCPCALVISIPLGFFAGLGGAGRAGILIRSSAVLESLSRTGTAVFDKTGTLTSGEFTVTEIRPVGIHDSELIRLLAHAESCSSHPVAAALRRAFGQEPDPGCVSEIREISGKGITAVVDGIRVAAGNEKLMADLGIDTLPDFGSGAVIHAAVDGVYAGSVRMSDMPREHACAAVAGLRKLGTGRIVMLTGDSALPAGETAAAVGIREFHSSLLPEDKVRITKALLQGKKPGTALVFAGDGLNDAPVLSVADVGVAMGGIGSDAAMEAADAVLMHDDPLDLVVAVRHSRRCMRIIREGIVFALAVKLLCLVLGALGVTGMFLAVFADVGVMLLCVLNSIRCLRITQIRNES